MTNSNINKHGLHRALPEAVKAEVRRRCGFGCVVCGALPYQYDHFRVPWSEAKAHDPEDIVLLCDRHHSLKTKGMITVEWISEAMRVSPEDRTARFRLPGTNPQFQIEWPGNVHVDADVHGVEIDGRSVFKLEYQADELEPVVVSGELRGKDGRLLCVIDRNELIVRPSDVFDFTLIGNTLTIRDKHRGPAIGLSLSSRALVINRITHQSNGCLLYGDKRGIWLCNGLETAFFSDMAFESFKVAVSARSKWAVDYEKLDITRQEPAFSLKGSTISGAGTGGAISM